MRNIERIVFCALFIVLFAAGSVSINAQQTNLITGNSAGNVRIGMTVGESRTALRGFSFSRASDGEGIALVEIKLRNQTQMTLYAGEFDANAAIDNAAKIEFIEVWGRNYRTAEGVFPGMRIQEAEREYGQILSIMRSEIEAREFGRFTKQPTGMDFRLQNRNGMAGIYPSGNTITTRYSPNAYISGIIVLGTPTIGSLPEEGDGDSNTSGAYSSLYTDLRTQCRTPSGQRRDGGHVSTYCTGYGGYQIHMFDSATTMEINIESIDKQKSVHLASQSLSFNRDNMKVEWRMKDGKPFAVIMRVYSYQLGNDGMIKYPEIRTGEFLAIKGLPGFEHIDYSVNIRTESNANEKAHQMADEAYSNETGNNSNLAYQNVNISRYNSLIDIGARDRQEWVRSASQVVVKLAGEMEEMRSRTIQLLSASAENTDTITAVITDEGLLDDSVSAQKLRLELRKNSSGIWKITSGQKSWSCQTGRGHKDFSAVMCR